MREIKKSAPCSGIRFSLQDETGQEVGRAYLYIMENDLHTAPFGLMEDVFIDSSKRGTGIGSELIKKVIKEAQKRGCYKLIATCRHSRPKVHKLYENLGFKNHGIEFRIDF